MPVRNLFHPLPEPNQGECVEPLLHQGNVLIERIVSPPNFESRSYCQEQDEWVALLQGRARIRIGSEELTLTSGDSLFIPASTPHQVLATSTEPLCIWLATHIFPHDRASGPLDENAGAR